MCPGVCVCACERRSSNLKRILRTLPAPATLPAQNHERVVDYEQNSEDAPRASTATRRKPQQSPPAENHERVVDSKQNSEDDPRASAVTRSKPRDVCQLRTEFRGRSKCQHRHPPDHERVHPPKTARKASIQNQILRMLQAPTPPPAENHKKVVDYEQNSADAPSASAATCRLRTEF